MNAIKRLGRRSRLLSITVVAVFFGANVGVAFAYLYQNFTPGAVGAGHIWADSTSRTFNYAYTPVDHQGCVGVSNNGGGIVPSGGQGREIFQLAACSGGPGSASGPINASGFPGVQNPNGSTTDHFGASYGRY